MTRLYNFSDGFKDFAELIRLQNAQNAPEDFWQAIKEDEFLSYIMEEIAKSQNYTADKNINQFIDNIESIRRSTLNNKTIIVAHSEGTLFANAVAEQIINRNSNMQECVGVVLVGGAASRVVNPDLSADWTRSNGDFVIGGFDIIADPLDANISNYPDDPNPNILKMTAQNQVYGDIKGHGYIEIYTGIPHIKNKIKNDILALKQRLDEQCVEEEPEPPVVNCGTPINVSGGQLSAPEKYRVDLGSQGGQVNWEFEAYSVPDALNIKINGRKIYDTVNEPYAVSYDGVDGLVSGYYSESFNVSERSSGTNQAEIEVSAPHSGTAWYANLMCPGQSLPNSRTRRIGFSASLDGYGSCKVYLIINNQPVYNPSFPQRQHYFSGQISERISNSSGRSIARVHFEECDGNGDNLSKWHVDFTIDGQQKILKTWDTYID